VTVRLVPATRACPIMRVAEYGQRCSRRAESYHPGAALAHSGARSTGKPVCQSGRSGSRPPSVRLKQATWVGNLKTQG